MKYEARYNNQAAIDAVINQIVAWEQEHYGYYAMYGGGGLYTDADIARKRSFDRKGLWYDIPASLPITYDSLRGHWAAWRTCKGNLLQYTFPEDGGVVVLAEGRRHGIRYSPLADMEPDKVLCYETLSPSQPWSEFGIKAEIPIPPNWQELQHHKSQVKMKHWLELCDKITHPYFAILYDDYYDLEEMRKYIASAKLEPEASILLDERLAPMGIYVYTIKHPEVGHIAIIWDEEKKTMSARGLINTSNTIFDVDYHFDGWNKGIDERAQATITINKECGG